MSTAESPALPLVRVVHVTGPRVRLKMERMGSFGSLTDFTHLLRELPSVSEAELRSRTGSVVLVLREPVSAFLAEGRQRGLFQVKGLEAVKPIPQGERLWRRLKSMNDGLRRLSHNQEDIQTLMFWTFTALGTYQMIRGKRLPAATTLFSSAIQALAASHKEYSSGSGTAD